MNKNMAREKRNLYIHLTDKCNLFCLHCYCGERLVKKREMSLPFFKNVINLLVDEFDVITLTGGEAVLSPIFYKAVKILKKHNCYIRMDTNGQDLDMFFQKIKPSDISQLRFSLDGSTPDINNLIRRKNNSFSNCVKNIKKAIKLGFFIELTSTIGKQNYKDVGNIINLARELKVSVMNFHLVTINGNSCYNDVEISPLQWMNVIKKHIEPAKDITIKYPPRFSINSLPSDYCGCVGHKNNRLSVFPNGQAFNCALFFDTDLSSRIIKKNAILFPKGKTEKDQFMKTMKNNCLGCQRFYQITTFKNKEYTNKNIIPLCIYYKKTINCSCNK